MNCYVCYQEWSFSSLGIFGFGHFLGRFFVFCTEKLRFLGFVGGCGLRFFGFLAPGFLTKIKQVRFFSGSLHSPDVNSAILYDSILLSIQVKLQCGITSIRPLPRPPRLNMTCKDGFARLRGLKCSPRWRSRFHI